MQTNFYGTAVYISIHAPARGATGEYNTRDDGVVISIHAPARGATVLQGLQPKRAFDFNPRPREGGDHDQKYQQGEDEISIHAPARGATQRIQPGTAPLMISIHAPARGATRRSWRACRTYGNFNPRPREGGDGGGGQLLHLSGISIHAPARGATLTNRTASTSSVHFNPRPREGGDELGLLLDLQA